MNRMLVLFPIFVALAAVFLSQRRETDTTHPIPGRNNTVLFLTTDSSGCSNVHVAAVSALLKNHPEVEIHYASFSKTHKRLKRVSTAAPSTNTTGSFGWHELSGPGFEDAIARGLPSWNDAISPPGLKGVGKMMSDFATCVLPWEADEHWRIYSEMIDIIDKVDPALIILDGPFTPAGDIAFNVNRRFITLSPNTVAEIFGMGQPWGAAFWKFPAMASGIPYPVPWDMIPRNIFLVLWQIWAVLTEPKIPVVREYLQKKGVKNPLQLGFIVPGVPTFMATLPEANLPVESLPEDTRFYGPIVIDTAPVAEQDPELAVWLKRAPTVLVNLGTLVQLNEERTRAMTGALKAVLDSTNNQVLWKIRTIGNISEEIFNPVRPFMMNGRLRIERWLDADPISIMETGDVVLSVHHGGAGCYHEAIFTGIPQVILPLWFDLYSIARTAEYLGIGIWPGHETAPTWDSETLAQGILEALNGKSSAEMRRKSSELSVKARSYGGKAAVARDIANLAAQGGIAARL
ncbi:hypothetical protein B0I35DRAFT_413592 [Stachybotrys elegans]|uniref:Erythromycin biosynthesis protein CIII-like C-terminal domain-containing protein n=1 Tax=Stachybotrys elegans TaxID=80388 RepID=A0A8K0SEY1_9HYPO|nr:hypothetical protein B0I35DRAFT_413592 [Stachybotrys elegans]